MAPSRSLPAATSASDETGETGETVTGPVYGLGVAKKPKTVYECTTCGDQAPKWIGRCNGCGHWNTLIETMATASGFEPAAHLTAVGEPARLATELSLLSAAPVSSGIGEFDRVLGGGFVASSTTLVGGEPGVGKSTLLGQVAALRGATGDPVLYVSAEESVQQVSARLQRLEHDMDNLWIGGEANLGRILADMIERKPKLVIIDSIQTIFDPQLASAPGSVGQVRHCASELARAAKAGDCAVVLVGQVTKDGNLAGPRVLEHLVDTVISFDGDRDFGLRLLRAVKHRFGPTGEIGVLEMTGRGLVEVGDPSGMLLADRRPDVAGSAITVAVEGRRPLVVELQALVASTAAPVPRRSTQGIDKNRLSMLLAVLTQRAGLSTSAFDVYASVIGGIRLSETGIDLGVTCAVASSVVDTPIPSDVVILGEVGLAGEVRSVSLIDRRVNEAARLGFQTAIIPAGSLSSEPPMQCIPVATVAGALHALFGENAKASPQSEGQARRPVLTAIDGAGTDGTRNEHPAGRGRADAAGLAKPGLATSSGSQVAVDW